MTETDLKQNNPVAIKEDDIEIKSMAQIVASQFFEHKLAVVGLLLIVFLVTIALSAPLISWVTGIDPDEQNVFNRYKPLFSETEMSSGSKESLIDVFVTRNPTKAIRAIAALKTAGLIDGAANDEDALFDLIIEADQETLQRIMDLGSDDLEQIKTIIKSFKTFHLLGTDELGRDVFLRLIYGARISIGVGIFVALASAIIGLIIGCISGFYGGWVDGVLSRITESMLSIPRIPLLIVFAAVDLKKLPFFDNLIGGDNESMFKLVIILMLFSWMTVARLIRASVLSIKEMEFVLAAKTLGSRDSGIMARHIVPNVIAPLLVYVTLNVGNSILMEAAMSYLGLGIQPPMPSWGNMLTNAQELIFDAPFLAIIPGVMILITVVSFNFVGDGLRDAIDPKAIKR